MRDSKREITELVRILIDSTCNYTAPRIQSEKNRFAYVRAVSRCLAVCGDPENKDDFNKMELELLKMLHVYVKNHPANFEFFSDTSKYYKMGIEHVLDIVECISKRFDGNNHLSTDKLQVRSVLSVFNDSQEDPAPKEKKAYFI
jgi:hypothetical protein